MRVTQPYHAVTPEVRPDDAPVVGSAPTMLTRRVYGAGAFRGLQIQGNKAQVTPVRHPWAGQGLISPVFPYYQPSSVAPDFVSQGILLTANHYSPVSHAGARYLFSCTMPARAAQPVKRLPTQNNSSRRGGGAAYSYPSPFVTSDYPTSSQFLADRVRGGLPGA